MPDLISSPVTALSSSSAEARISGLEAALAERDRELEDMRDLAGLGSWRWEKATDTMVWSPKIYEIHGQPVTYRHASIKELRALADQPPSVVELLDAFDRAANEGIPYEMDVEIVRPDGSVRWILTRARAQYNEQGVITHVQGLIQEITARKTAELELALSHAATREREQRFAALAESLPQLIWTSDSAGGRLFTNRRYLEYAGLSSAELGGDYWQQIIHPDDISTTLDLWSRSVQSGEPYVNEYRMRRHDGVYRTFLLRAHPVHLESGAIDYWVGCATDIEDRKLAEEQLRRTEKLAATGRLAASIAHEINNPLEAVTNLLYLARTDNALTPETRAFLITAEQELARVGQVVTQTLRFHRQSTAPQPADLAELVDSACALFASRLRQCGIELQREYAPGFTLRCLADELRQVFANLVSNALDATRHGGRIRIRIRRSTGGPGGAPALRIIVADTGHGIPDHVRGTIFEPFVTTKDTTGTGLGLWVTDGIVRKHGGHIRVRSRCGVTGHGTVFNVHLPMEGLAPLGASVARTPSAVS